MCTTLGKIRVESTLTDNRHAQTSEGRLVNKKVTIIPLYGDKKFGSVPPREGRKQSRVHPDLLRQQLWLRGLESSAPGGAAGAAPRHERNEPRSAVITGLAGTGPRELLGIAPSSGQAALLGRGS